MNILRQRVYEYTEAKSKYTGEIETHSMWKQMYIKKYAERSKAKNFWNLKKKTYFLC